MKIKHFINIHKGATAPAVFGLMLVYDNFSTAAWIYLALHGTYGALWLIKDQVYPDKSWEQPMSLAGGVGMLVVLGLYWIAPFILISQNVSPPGAVMAAAVSLNIFGVFAHYVSDAQKHFTLKYQPGLITEGLFARCRNTNYLGEILIYFSFALLALHWLPFVILAGFAAAIFVPNMLKKDKSLARYPQFEAYRAQSGMLVPQLWGEQQVEASGEEVTTSS